MVPKDLVQLSRCIWRSHYIAQFYFQPNVGNFTKWNAALRNAHHLSHFQIFWYPQGTFWVLGQQNQTGFYAYALSVVKSSKVGFTKILSHLRSASPGPFFCRMPATLGFTLHIIKHYAILQRLNHFEKNGYLKSLHKCKGKDFCEWYPIKIPNL
jgi:hypothetical protein